MALFGVVNCNCCPQSLSLSLFCRGKKKQDDPDQIVFMYEGGESDEDVELCILGTSMAKKVPTVEDSVHSWDVLTVNHHRKIIAVTGPRFTAHVDSDACRGKHIDDVFRGNLLRVIKSLLSVVERDGKTLVLNTLYDGRLALSMDAYWMSGMMQVGDKVKTVSAGATVYYYPTVIDPNGFAAIAAAASPTPSPEESLPPTPPDVNSH